MMNEYLEFDDADELSLLETLDHVLESGLVIAGEVTISVAHIDLIYIGLNVLLGSVETVNEVLRERERKHAEGESLLTARARRALDAEQAARRNEEQ